MKKRFRKNTLNLDTLKNISNQKAGRDFLITKNFVEKIIKNINVSADKKEQVLYYVVLEFQIIYVEMKKEKKQ